MMAACCLSLVALQVRCSLDVPSKNPLLAALLQQSELTMITVLLADQFVVNITATRVPVEITIATLHEFLSLLSSSLLMKPL